MKYSVGVRSDQIRSVAQSCLTLCDPMNRSTPGLPVHHQLPEFTETHVHRVSDAIQPSHPLSSPVFSNESTLRMRWPKYWNFSFSISPSKEIPGLISFRMDWLWVSASIFSQSLFSLLIFVTPTTQESQQQEQREGMGLAAWIFTRQGCQDYNSC